MISRLIEKQIIKQIHKGKAIVIFGPRQTGKTTLLNSISGKLEDNILRLDGDEPDVRNKLTDITSTQLKKLFGNHKIVMIDEAQLIKNIGLTIKLIVDKIKDVQVIATGSSSFELANEINEPLTGRKHEFMLFPLSTGEMINDQGERDETRLLEHRLIYGMYPEVVTNPGKEKEILKGLTGSYLYKDLFTFQDIRRSSVIQNLLELLALQVGSEVSVSEISRNLQIDSATVERYIRLLEQAFIIFRLRSFSRNARNELKKSRKIYFYDNGIRNAIIVNYNPPNIRQDKGALWENFLVSERQKYNHYNSVYNNIYFWRTTQQQEIDYIEESNGFLYAYEFKWMKNQKERVPKTFKSTYPESSFTCISKDNYIDFLQP